MKRIGSVVIWVFLTAAIGVGAQSRFDAEAVRLNNRGVALMGQ